MRCAHIGKVELFGDAFKFCAPEGTEFDRAGSRDEFDGFIDLLRKRYCFAMEEVLCDSLIGGVVDGG